MRGRILVLAAGAAWAACAACADPNQGAGGVVQGGEPLIGGTLDEGDEAVVSLLSGSGNSFCTGTLVSPTIVLTAAHCIDMAGGDPDITAFFGTDIASTGRRVGVVRAHKNPAYDSGRIGRGDANDVGLILLVASQDPTLPIPMNSDPATQHVGDPYRMVGFGIYDRPGQIADGRKRTGTSAVNDTFGDTIETGDDVVGVCYGDSGGPGFLTIDGVEQIAGIHSYTSNSDTEMCVPPMGDTRVDSYLADFIQPWIDDNDPACGSDGACARIGCTADPDCEPCGGDGTCAEDCELPDVDCPTSGIGEICQGDSQCTDGGPCVFWHGDPSTHFCTRDCSGGGACPDGMSCQNITGVGQVCYYDDDPPGVVGSECSAPTDCGSYLCDDSACVTVCDLSIGKGCPVGFECKAATTGPDYYCRALPDEGGGGCAVQGQGAPAAASGLLALAALALLRARRRR